MESTTPKKKHSEATLVKRSLSSDDRPKQNQQRLSLKGNETKQPSSASAVGSDELSMDEENQKSSTPFKDELLNEISAFGQMLQW